MPFFGATKLQQALHPLELAQEAKAPRSSSITFTYPYLSKNYGIFVLFYSKD